jgi:hypothetical protein
MYASALLWAFSVLGLRAGDGENREKEAPWWARKTRRLTLWTEVLIY